MAYLTLSSGLNLSYLITTKNPDSSKIVIIIHGLFCTKNSRLYVLISDFLEFNSIRFDFEGCGDSEGETYISNYLKEVENVHSVVLWCRSQGYDVLAIIGHSKGANNAIIYSALYDDVSNYICLAPRLIMTINSPMLNYYQNDIINKGITAVKIKAKEYFITKEHIKEKNELDMRKYCENAKNTILLIHGDNDEVIPISDSYQTSEILGQHCKEFFVVKGANHLFECFEQEISSKINSFLLYYLNNQII